jgi:AcrR family transcriptional regulator
MIKKNVSQAEILGGGYDPVRTRQRIIESALELFSKNGYNGTAVQEIAQLAELTKGAFYHHFATKIELLLTIQMEYLDTQLEMLTPILKLNLSSEEVIEKIMTVGLEMIVSHRAHVAIFYQERRFFEEPIFESVRAKRLLVETLILNAINNGVKNKEITPEINAHLLAFCFLGMTAYSFQWYDENGALSPKEVAHQFCEIAFKGVSLQK